MNEQAKYDYLYISQNVGHTCETCDEFFANISDLNTHQHVHDLSYSSQTSDICQLDGNDSCNESSLFTEVNDSTSHSSSIPVLISSRAPQLHSYQRRPRFNRHIRKDNNLLEALNLPAFTVYNMRSLWSKMNNLAEDIIERDVDISFLSEVWEKKENVQHQSSIEEMLEMKGIAYISTPRPGARRGGGTAIAACPKKFSLVKLHVEIPKSIEVVWGLLRPKNAVGSIDKIILCSFYCPPRSKKRSALIDHISTVLNKLKVEHPNAATIIAGDKNDLDETRILALDPALAQLVRRPTRKDKILSIVITDLRRFFIEPTIVDPIPVDNPTKGVPSDHNGVLVEPLTNIQSTKDTSKITKYVRPFPDSSVAAYRKTLGQIDWPLMVGGMSSSDMVNLFQKITTDLVDIHFPLKKISISPYDKPWMTEELKAMRRRRQRFIGRKEEVRNIWSLNMSLTKIYRSRPLSILIKLRWRSLRVKEGAHTLLSENLGTGNMRCPKVWRHSAFQNLLTTTLVKRKVVKQWPTISLPLARSLTQLMLKNFHLLSRKNLKKAEAKLTFLSCLNMKFMTKL